jgi:GAF domain-containing protein/HAMP domain-containing protein
VILDSSNPALLEAQKQARNSILIGIIGALITGAIAAAAYLSGLPNQFASILLVFFASLALIGFSRIGRYITGGVILISVISLQTVFSLWLEKGSGISSGILAMALIGTIGLLIFSRQYIPSILLLGLVVSILSVMIDLFGPAARPQALSLQFRWVLSIAFLIVFMLLFAREFNTFDIRTKIVFGILMTGGLALAILAYFAVDRAGLITASLSQRLETGVSQLAEERLINIVGNETNQLDTFFGQIASNVNELAKYRASLQKQETNLNLGTYWDAHTKLYQFQGGQYGNLPEDVSSVFIPVNTELTEGVFAELNTSAYMDFSVPNALAANPAILAIYYINPLGITRYYPNINLASVVPPDFNPTKRPYYQITAPVFNPNRLTRWAIPYVDAAGGGLVVTVASPVYFEDQFNGVVAADVQISKVTQRISSLKIGQTGFAYMVDDAGRIISMPPEGYNLYGINPNDLPKEEFFKQTILGAGSFELSSITRRMVAGGTGLNIIKANGVDTYISYSPVKTNGYSVALVVPVSEMQGAIRTARFETQTQLQAAARLAAIIFIGLVFLALVISIAISRFIAAPIIQLTQTANQIVAGDLMAQASVPSRDEIGTLAQAFNTMTARLRETLAGLEQRVAERTSEVLNANEKVERRAKQFATISQVAHVITQTQRFEELLPRIAQTISERFNFYHVGVFLLDENQEYAVLAASNSEGGRRMLAREHKLKVGQVGMVGNVAGSGAPRIALDTGADAAYFNNPDLPETHSEMALPLFGQGQKIIGVLDVQSTEVNAFNPEDIEVLSTLSEQVSVAIANSQLYEETQKALSEAELVYRGELRTGWQKFSRSLKLAGIRRKGIKSMLISEPVNIPGQAEVMASGKNYQTNDGKWQMTIPVKLRDEVVGLLNIKSDEHRNLTLDQLDIIKAIVERAALSIESARLIEESQRRAKKEQAIGEISTKIGSLVNIDNILQTAILELGNTLPNTDIAIQFEKEKESK